MMKQVTQMIYALAISIACMNPFFGNAQSKDEKDLSKKRPENGKYITIDKAELELEEGDLSESVFSSENQRKKGRTTRSISNEREFKQFSRSLYSQVMDRLIELDYIDTTDRFLPDFKNSLKLEFIIEEVHIDFIKPKKSNHYTAGYVEMVMHVELKSHYGKTLISKDITRERGPLRNIAGIYDEMDVLVDEVIVDFLTSEEVLEKVSFEGVFDFFDETKFDPIALKHTARTSGMADWRESVVTVFCNEGHGSACVVSSDGYMVTNFHVVEQASEVKVKFMNGEETSAKVLRCNADSDLALLKVEKIGLKYLTPASYDAVLGETVFVIGTPADTLLAQSVSKGIVSGTRTYEGVTLIQTDAKVNRGNSGGALISSDGKLLGVVSAKYSGYGIEGIGFAVPASRLREKLRLEIVLPVTAPSTAPASKPGKKK